MRFRAEWVGSIVRLAALPVFALGGLNGAEPETDSMKPPRELIGDPHFAAGFVVQSPVPGKVVHVGKLLPTDPEREPVWRLAQWSSRHSLAGTAREDLPGGAFVFANAAKRVIVAPRDHDFGELVLGVQGRAEYGVRVRRKGEPWPHLLLAQRFREPPSIDRLVSAHFTVEARLRHARVHEDEGYTPRLHAAQFQVFFNVQNLNRASKGYGDYLYFGIPLYDSRWRTPHRFHNPDQVGKFIYTPPGSIYAGRSMHDGEWVRVEKDLLPLMKEALAKAWERGFLADSHDHADYFISAMNLGWEIPGTVDAEVQMRDLSLEITTQEHVNTPGANK